MNRVEQQRLLDLGYEFNGTIAVPLEVAAVDTEETSLEKLLSHETAPESPVAGEKAQLAKHRTNRRDTVEIFDPMDVDRALRQLKSRLGDREHSRMFEARLKEMLNHGPERRLSKPSKARLKRLEAIRQACPNFAEVVEFLSAETRLAMASKRAVFPSPILLAGPPGVGKSHFAELLSGVYESPLHRVQVEQADSAAVLSGTGAHWANTRTGLLFNALVDVDANSNAGSASPVILLDEIDKFSTRDTGQSSISCLYGLLEEQSAKKFRDASLSDVPIDARHVVWLATANELDRLPAPILSRFRIFHIPQPTREQARRIVQAIYHDIVSSYRLPTGFNELPDEALDALISESPRAARRMLREALGRALSADAECIRKEHIAKFDGVPAAAPMASGQRIIYVISHVDAMSTPVPRSRLH